MRRLFLIWVLILMSTTAFAKRELVYRHENDSFFIDLDSIKTIGDLRQAWTLESFAAPQVRGQGSPAVQSVRRLYEFDCRLGKGRVLLVMIYSGPMGTGKHLDTDEPPDPWTPYPPDTNAGLILKKACHKSWMFWK